jgi:hypothetical protein
MMMKKYLSDHENEEIVFFDARRREDDIVFEDFAAEDELLP